MSQRRQRTDRAQEALTWSSANEVDGLASAVLTTDDDGNITGILSGGTNVPLVGGAGGIEVRGDDPTSPAEGDVWFNTTTNTIRYFDGTTVQTVSNDPDSVGQTATEVQAAVREAPIYGSTFPTTVVAVGGAALAAGEIRAGGIFILTDPVSFNSVTHSVGVYEAPPSATTSANALSYFYLQEDINIINSTDTTTVESNTNVDSSLRVTSKISDAIALTENDVYRAASADIVEFLNPDPDDTAQTLIRGSIGGIMEVDTDTASNNVTFTATGTTGTLVFPDTSNGVAVLSDILDTDPFSGSVYGFIKLRNASHRIFFSADGDATRTIAIGATVAERTLDITGFTSYRDGGVSSESSISGGLIPAGSAVEVYEIENVITTDASAFIDQTYDGTSARAQSGVAVAEAIVGVEEQIEDIGITTSSSTPPASPAFGDKWIDLSSGVTYRWTEGATDEDGITGGDNWIQIAGIGETAAGGTTSGGAMLDDDEQNFLNQVTETDTVAPGMDAHNASTNIIRFWLGLDSSSIVPLTTSTAQVGSYQAGQSNLLNTQLYIGVPATTTNPVDRLVVNITDISGDRVESFRLQGSATTLTSPPGSDSGYTYYRLSRLIHLPQGGEVTLFIDEVDMRFTLGTDVDVTNNITNLPETSLDSETQSKINRQVGFDSDTTRKLSNITQMSTQSAIGQLNNNDGLLVKRAPISHNSTDYIVYGTGAFLPSPLSDGADTYYVLVDDDVTLESYREDGGGSRRATVTEIVPSIIDSKRTYRVVVPSTNDFFFYLPFGTRTVVERLLLTDQYEVRELNLSQAITDKLNHVTPSETLQTFDEDLSFVSRADSDDETTWEARPNPYRTTLTRQAAILWDERRSGDATGRVDGNYFQDLGAITARPGVDSYFIFTDPDVNSAINDVFPGRASFTTGEVTLANATGGSTIGAGFNKLILFDINVASSNTSEDESILRFPRATPLNQENDDGTLLNISGAGISLRVGNNDATTGTTTENVRTDVGTIHLTSGDRTAGDGSPINGYAVERDIILGTNNPTGTYRLEVSQVGNGRFEGSRTFPIDIDNPSNISFIANDRTSPVRDVTFLVSRATNTRGQEVLRISYDSATVNPTGANTQNTTNSALDPSEFGIYNWGFTLYTFETVTTAGTDQTFRDHPLAGHTTGVHENSSIALVIERSNPEDTSLDPLLSARVIVNGVPNGLVTLNRTATSLNFAQMTFGVSGRSSDDQVGVSRVQVYGYSDVSQAALPGHTGSSLLEPVTDAELLDMYNARERWVGAFRHPNEQVERFELAALMGFTGTLGGVNVRAVIVENTDGDYVWSIEEIVTGARGAGGASGSTGLPEPAPGPSEPEPSGES